MLQEHAVCDRQLECYLKNLAALYRVDRELAAQVDALPFSACPALEPTRDGHWTARVTADDGRPVYVHSRYEPLEEARRLIETQCGQSDSADSANRSSFFVGGVGLGYHLLELEQRFDRPLLIVAEDDLALLKAALYVSDLSELLAQRRLLFITRPDKGQVHEVLRPVHTDLLLGLELVSPPYAARHHTSFQSATRGLLQDFLSFARLQMLTLLRNARVTCRNILFNLWAYLRRPGVEVLAGKAQGYPAILVAAGPSLARNVDQLRDLADRTVIIAVQTVLKHLLSRGIVPHFVTSLDFHEISAQFFHGLNQDPGSIGRCILVAEPKAAWQVLEVFPGRAHLLHNTLYDALLGPVAPPRGRIRAGSTVAHLSFYLAEYLGCDPIILVGQDLAFCDGLYYPPGMPIEQIWQPELNRFYTVEMKQWERIVRARPILRMVEDIHGRRAYTDEQLFSYAEQFQRDFAVSSARVIHACEGGMRFVGTEVMTLFQAAERFCNRPLPAGLFSDADRFEPLELARRAADELRKRIRELEDVTQIAREMRQCLTRLSELLDRPAEFNRTVARVDDLRVRIRRYEDIYQMVVGVSQLAELRRYSADRRIGTCDRETVEVARRRLARDREFVDAFIEGCEFLAGLLPQALDRLNGKFS